MNESDFEAELRALIPAKPSARVEAAIGRELSEKQSHPAPVVPASGVLIQRTSWQLGRWWYRLAWAAAGGAVAAAMLLIPAIPSRKTAGHDPVVSAPAPEPEVFEPVASDRQLLASQDGGVVYDEETGPSQIVQYSSVERYSWTNAAGALVEVEVPREDLVMIPVSYQ